MKKLVALLSLSLFFLMWLPPAWAAPEVHLWFPSPYKDKTEQTRLIAETLAKKSGLNIVPKVAGSYSELLTALSEKSPEMAYVGSMVAVVIWSRRLGVPLFQAVDGKHLYAGIMVFPKGQTPEAILKDTPAGIAYTIGATSGEVCAKVATGGKASLAMPTHDKAIEAVKSGKAKAAFVKDFWWDNVKEKHPELDAARLPGISVSKNPDNVLLVSSSVTPEIRGEIIDAAFHHPEAFNAVSIVPFDSSSLDFTLSLMQKAGIDPLTYTWPE